MTSEHLVPQICLVVKWSVNPAAEPVALELARRLAGDGIAATWAVASASQVEKLRKATAKAGQLSVALAAAPHGVDQSGNWVREITSSLNGLRASGANVATMQTAGQPPRGNYERAIHALGIRAIIVDAAAQTAGVRPLPFGLWQLTPRLAMPTVRRWTRLFSRSPRLLIDRTDATPALASIDAARLASAGSRATREVERTIQQLVQAKRLGTVAVVTAEEIAEQLASTNAARPQRSILRAA